MKVLAALSPRRSLVVALTWALVLLLAIFALALFSLKPETSGRNVPLDRVVDAAVAKQLPSVWFLDEDSRLIGNIVLTEGGAPQPFWSSYPRSDAATNDLLKTFLANDVRVQIDSQTGKAFVRFIAQFLLPLVLLANLFALLFSLSKGGAGKDLVNFGQIGDKRLGDKGKSATTFLDVAAAEEAIVELAEVRDYLADPAAFARMGALPPKGVLIAGPPGCGKTLLARAVAGEAKAAFFPISGSEFVESLVGVGAARVRDLFKQARAAAPAIIFIDELDAVGRQRGAGLGGGHDEREQTLNQLLVEMDGFSPSEGVAVLAATNRIDILDPALLRPGRFDRRITVERPDRDGRLSIIRLHAKGKRLADPDGDLPEIARRTPGFTGADLSSVLNEAALLAVRERSQAITRHHLEEGVERVIAGPRRKATVILPDDKRRIAFHEAGHTVVAAALGMTAGIDKVSVIARGGGIGHLALLSDDQMLPTRPDLEARIAIAMAGIAAEELVLGHASTGGEADIERATNSARDLAGRFGMSNRLGRVRLLREQREVFLGRDYLLTQEVSQPTLEHLDAEVRQILDEQEGLARSILMRNRAVLDTLSASLISQETVQGDALRDGLANVRPWKPPTKRTPKRESTNDEPEAAGAGE